MYAIDDHAKTFQDGIKHDLDLLVAEKHRAVSVHAWRGVRVAQSPILLSHDVLVSSRCRFVCCLPAVCLLSFFAQFTMTRTYSDFYTALFPLGDGIDSSSLEVRLATWLESMETFQVPGPSPPAVQVDKWRD